MKKKKESAEEFVGWKSEDGLLEVIDIYGKQGSTRILRILKGHTKCKSNTNLFIVIQELI